MALSSLIGPSAEIEAVVCNAGVQLLGGKEVNRMEWNRVSR